MVRSDSLAFLDDLVLDNSNLPPLIDSPYAGGGASSSSFAAAGMNGSGEYQVVKAEQQPRPQLSAASNSPAAGGSYTYAYSYQQRAREPRQAIRRHCKAEASVPATLLLSPSRGGVEACVDMFHVDDLPQLDGFMDYSNMWKI